MTRTTVRRHATSLSGRGLAVAVALTCAGLAAVPSAAARSGSTQHEPIGDPLPDVRQGPVQVGLKLVTQDVTAPLAGITAPGRPAMMYLVDQVGQLKELDLTAAQPVRKLRTVLDVSSVLVGPQDPKDERGFLGAAFSPNVATDGLLFTYTSEAFDRAHPADFPLRADPPGPCDLRGCSRTTAA